MKCDDFFQALEVPDDHRQGLASGLALVLLVVGAALTTVLILYTAFEGGLTALLLRSAFLSLTASFALWWMFLKQRHHPLAWLWWPLGAMATLAGPYLFIHYEEMVMAGAMAEEVETGLFVLTVIAVMAMARAYLGRFMVGLGLVALAYALWGNLIPGDYGHAGYALDRMASNLLLRTEGLYGLPMGVAAEYIFLFSLLGAVLLRTGLGQVFVDIAQALTGRIQGGAGLTAVVSSTLFSSINGSAVAGVVTTGTFTIPLMKRSGYRPKVAGAIEAAASSAGQIMPPVMGAAAFLMAEITQTPYAEIAAAALIPALLYVFALLVSVRLEAGKYRLRPLDEADIPAISEVLLRRGYMLTPLVVLVGALIVGYTPSKAAVMAIGVALVLSLFRREGRLGLRQVLLIMVESMVSVTPVVAAVAVAGILIGVLTLTGLALKLSSMILVAGGDSLFLVLVLTMLTSFVLGMGMPTSAAYLLLAILIAPALVKFGLPVIAAHMFIFYYGLLSAITPPVALAAYAGASIAGAEPTETAVEAMRMGFVKVVAPFLFVYSPALLLEGTWSEVAWAALWAFSATFALSVAFTAWLGRRLKVWEIAGLVLAFVLLSWPFPADWLLGLRVLGLAAMLVLVWSPLQHWKSSRLLVSTPNS